MAEKNLASMISSAISKALEPINKKRKQDGLDEISSPSVVPSTNVSSGAQSLSDSALSSNVLNKIEKSNQKEDEKEEARNEHVDKLLSGELGEETKENQRQAVLNTAANVAITPEVQRIYQDLYKDGIIDEPRWPTASDEHQESHSNAIEESVGKAKGVTDADVMMSLFGMKDSNVGSQDFKDIQSSLKDLVHTDKKNYINEQNEGILSHYQDSDNLGLSNLGDPDSEQTAFESVVDDGNMRIENLTSEKMTVAQYIKQREAGVPGRPLEELYKMNPNDLISKVDEQRLYGYQPYWTNQFDEIKRQGTKLMEYPSDLANNLSNARSNADYSNTIGDKTFSGKEVDKKANDYFTQTAEQVNDTSRWSVDPNEDHTGMTGYKLGYKVILEDGTEERIDDDSPEYYPNADGTLTVYFPKENKTFQFDNEEDYNNNLQEDWDFADGEDDTPLAWVKFDDMVLDDGTALTFDEVREHVNGGGNPDYGFLNWAKPAERTQDFITENGFNFEDLVPKMTDITLSSVPYFHPAMSVPLAISNAVKAAQGLDPRKKDDETGAYSSLSENMTPEIQASAILGNAIMPATEIGLGRIGGKLVEKPLEGISRKIGERAWMPGAEWTLGSLGEGLEEIPSNIVEDWMVYGPSGLYANAVEDENGNKQYDSSGHEVRDENTSLFDRAGNFIADMPEAFIGGALLGSAFGIPDISNTVMDTADLYRNNKADKESGAGLWREVRPQDVYQRITEEELYKNRK